MTKHILRCVANKALENWCDSPPSRPPLMPGGPFAQKVFEEPSSCTIPLKEKSPSIYFWANLHFLPRHSQRILFKIPLGKLQVKMTIPFLRQFFLRSRQFI